MTNDQTARTRTVHFSIDGGFITRTARERLYCNNDLPGALDLLLSCTKTDAISKEERVGIAMAILDGTKALAGVYPGPDYGVVDVPEDERPDADLKSFFAGLRDRITDVEAVRDEFQDKLACIAENLSETQMQNIDREWRDCYADDKGGTIFGTQAQLTPGQDTMVQSFLRRMTGPCGEPDYGWLFPDGTFHPVEFGDHHQFAFDWLKEHEPDWYLSLPGSDPDVSRPGMFFSDAEDYLQSKYRAVLLHNPALGVAAVVTSGHELTKRQKEFLFDYYTKRGLADRASALYAGDGTSARTY